MALNNLEDDLRFRIHSCTVFVRSIDRALRFYLDELGFRLVRQTHIEIGSWAAIAPPDGTALLMLIEPEANSQEYEMIGRSRRVFFVAEDVAVNFKTWSNRGVAFSQPLRPTAWGGAQTSFEDPDGNSFVLVGYDAATREFEAERRAVQELDIARQVQSRLFPQDLPTLKTLEYAGLCLQARSVGGDYYDFIHTGPGQLAFVVADIAGKGIAAALIMASLHACLRSQRTIVLGHSGELLRSVNQFLCENTSDGVYATLFFAEYSDELRRLRYANCGHPPALLLRNDNTLELLNSTCPVVGLLDEWDCSVQECRLFPGDIFVLYTDGVIESVDRRGEEFGVQRLAEAIRRHRAVSSQELTCAIAEEIREFSPHKQADDITLVVAKCR